MTKRGQENTAASAAPRVRMTKKTKVKDAAKQPKAMEKKQKEKAREPSLPSVPSTPADKLRRTSSPTKSHQAHVEALMEVKKLAAGKGMSVEEYLKEECGEALTERLRPKKPCRKGKKFESESAEARWPPLYKDKMHSWAVVFKPPLHSLQQDSEQNSDSEAEAMSDMDEEPEESQQASDKSEDDTSSEAGSKPANDQQDEEESESQDLDGESFSGVSNSEEEDDEEEEKIERSGRCETKDAKPTKHNEDKKPTKHNEDKKPTKHNEDKKPTKHNEDKKPTKHNEDKKRTKHSDDSKEGNPESKKAKKIESTAMPPDVAMQVACAMSVANETTKEGVTEFADANSPSLNHDVSAR